MKKDIDSLKMRLKELDEKIKAVEKQLPAHSVKPPIMTQLFELEDERDAVFKELERLNRQSLNNTFEYCTKKAVGDEKATGGNLIGTLRESSR